MAYKKPKNLKELFEREYFGVYKKIFPNPDSILPYTENSLLTYKQMQTDPEINNCMRTLTSKILEQPLTIEGGNAEHVKFIEENFKNIKIKKQIQEMLQALIYGFAVHTIEYSDPKDNGGKYGLKELTLWGGKEFSAESYKFNLQDELLFLGRWGTYNPVNLTKTAPENYILTTFDPTSDNDYGTSLMMSLFWYWIFKKEAVKHWNQSNKRFGSPAIVATTNETGNDFQERLDAIAADIEKIESNAGVVLNAVASLQVLSNSASADNFDKIIKLIDNYIAKVILGSVKMSGSETQYGTYAAQYYDEKTLMSRVKYYVEMLTPTLDSLIKILIDINFGEQNEYPQAVITVPELANFEHATKLIELGVPVALEPLYAQYLPGLKPVEGGETFTKAEAPAPVANFADEKKKPLLQIKTRASTKQRS